ncbi:XrtA/PEP-CTERM system TPR-repeat protein PrsT [Aliiglaciecola litoralis]|uniref:PEP-CTERM system TPR-repeat protein PrsT n=1 Tax=Aliiglaciecola litoralis TaxID=582857 RepID=A0ABN1LMG6_9ALTE
MRSFRKYGVLLCVLALAGCSQKTPSEYNQEAEQAILKNDTESAIIVLKNALLSDPQNLRARFLLGSVYLQRGNAKSAEKELNIAYEGGYFKNEVLPVYLSSLDFLRRNDDIIMLVERLTGLSSETEAAAQAYKGIALFRKNQASRAKLAIKRATELAPQSTYSRLGRAYHAKYDGETVDAIIILDELLADQPDFMEAVLLRGQLNLVQQDYAAATADFEKYIQQKPGDAQGNFLLVDTLIRSEQYDQAESMLNDLLAKLPENAKLNEFLGILKYNKQDYAGAKLAMEQALAAGSNSATVKLIAGVSSFQQENLEQAHKHLASVQDVLPPSHPAKRLFAEIQLRLGYSSGAAETLKNLGAYDLSDVRLFTQAGFNLVRQGDNSSAQKMLDLAKQMDPTSATEKVRLGVLKLSLNDKSGIQDLEDALKIDPKSIQARLMLAQAYVRDEQVDQAIEVAKQWVDASPEEITAYNLLAELYEMRGNTELAKATHEDALALKPNNPASLKFMADVAKQQGNEAQALSMLEQAAKNNPDHINASLDYLIEARSQSEQKALDALALMREIYEQEPTNTLKSLNYARGLVLMQKPQETLEVLTKIPASTGMPLFYWKGQADSYLALNRPSDALNIYSTWQQLEPERREPWLAAIVIYDGIRDFKGALDTVKRSLNTHQNDGELQVMEVHYSLMNGNVSVAQRLLNSLPDKAKNSVTARGLQGHIYFAQKEFSKALPLLEERYNVYPDGRMALLIADAKTYLKQVDEGLAFMEAHLLKVPRDLDIRARLAERYMEKQPDKAISHYEVVLQVLPENIVVLNNLSWLYGKTGETAKAVDYAQRAVALRPENPKLLDTLGVALLKNGNVERAIEVSKKAFDKEPSNQTYRIHYEEAQKAKL